MTKIEQETDDYDSPWKEAIKLYFEPFIEFYFPQIHPLIDWSKPPEFLDKELSKIVRDSETGKHYVDQLVKVWQRDGKETYVLIHIEVQSQKDQYLPKRVYFYNTRISDHYGKPVVSLVILADNSPTWKPTEYRQEIWGCEIVLKFLVSKIREYPLAQLETSKNPFAIITLAHLTTQKTKNKPKTRYQGKLKLVRKLYEGGYSKQDILELFRLIDWIINLPKNWADQFQTELEQLEEKQKMPYVTSIERRALEKGEARGEARGIAKGEVRKSREDIFEVLEIRFNFVPENIINNVNQIEDLDILKNLLRQAVITLTLDDFSTFLTDLS